MPGLGSDRRAPTLQVAWGGVGRSWGDRSQQRWTLPAMHVPQPWEHTHQQALHIMPQGQQAPRGGQAGLEPGQGRAQPLSQQPSACSYSPGSPIPTVGSSPDPTVTKFSSPESEEVSQEDSVMLYLLAQWLLGKFLDCSVPHIPRL